MGTLPRMVSDRLQAWVRGHFGPSEVEAVLSLLTDLPAEDSDDAGNERIQAAVVLLSGGDSRRLLDAAALAEQDWRDVLVAAQLADGDWTDRLNSILGDAPIRPDTGRCHARPDTDDRFIRQWRRHRFGYSWA